LPIDSALQTFINVHTTNKDKKLRTNKSSDRLRKYAHANHVKFFKRFKSWSFRTQGTQKRWPV